MTPPLHGRPVAVLKPKIELQPAKKEVLAEVPPLHARPVEVLVPKIELQPGKNEVEAVLDPLHAAPVVVLLPMVEVQPLWNEATCAFAVLVKNPKLKTNIHTKANGNNFLIIYFLSTLILDDTFLGNQTESKAVLD